jgi:hypothetical protein
MKKKFLGPIFGDNSCFVIYAILDLELYGNMSDD